MKNRTSRALATAVMSGGMLLGVAGAAAAIPSGVFVEEDRVKLIGTEVAFGQGYAGTDRPSTGAEVDWYDHNGVKTAHVHETAVVDGDLWPSCARVRVLYKDIAGRPTGGIESSTEFCPDRNNPTTYIPVDLEPVGDLDVYRVEVATQVKGASGYWVTDEVKRRRIYGN